MISMPYMGTKKGHIPMSLMIAVLNTEDQPHILNLKEFIAIPDYPEYDLMPISPWEYGVLKLETTFIRVFITSRQPLWIKELDAFTKRENLRSEIGTVGGFRWLKSDGTIGHLQDGETMQLPT